MQLKELTTKLCNRAAENLDRMSTLELVTSMNREDASVPRALESTARNMPLALVMLKSKAGKAEAQRRLRAANSNVRTAIEG